MPKTPSGAQHAAPGTHGQAIEVSVSVATTKRTTDIGKPYVVERAVDRLKALLGCGESA
jgi:hypothetical protein